MAVFEVEVIIPITIQADNADEALDLAKKQVIVQRKDLRLSALQTGAVKQTSMF
jgi:hypothetical protein